MPVNNKIFLYPGSKFISVTAAIVSEFILNLGQIITLLLYSISDQQCFLLVTLLPPMLLLSTHSSLIIGGSPLLLSDGGSPPASPASHLAGLLRRRDPSRAATPEGSPAGLLRRRDPQQGCYSLLSSPLSPFTLFILPHPITINKMNINSDINTFSKFKYNYITNTISQHT